MHARAIWHTSDLPQATAPPNGARGWCHPQEPAGGCDFWLRPTIFDPRCARAQVLAWTENRSRGRLDQHRAQQFNLKLLANTIQGAIHKSTVRTPANPDRSFFHLFRIIYFQTWESTAMLVWHWCTNGISHVHTWCHHWNGGTLTQYDHHHLIIIKHHHHNDHTEFVVNVRRRGFQAAHDYISIN